MIGSMDGIENVGYLDDANYIRPLGNIPYDHQHLNIIVQLVDLPQAVALCSR